jgi:peptidoglycan/xylan/chitin deacetylase (PgdA/CDA1 family)
MQALRAYAKSAFAIVVGAAFAAAGLLAFAGAAQAEDCPGHPDALGTSRVLVVDPSEISQVGVMQYHQSLPLNDKEVVLTFDDGPVPRYSNAVLDILAAQCVKATYFLVGAMARAYPATVRRIYEEGHTIGTHTEDHPSRMQKLPIEKVRQEIDEGIADVGAALGDPTELAPFFRIPGLARTDAIDQELAARSLIVFSSDTVADDWHRRIKPAQIVNRAMSRLEARGKGILLLHDIHPATVAALPELLAKLKAAGFHVVHVVPAAAEGIETAGEPTGRDWHGWPAMTAMQSDDRILVPAPDFKSFGRPLGQRGLPRARRRQRMDRPDGHDRRCRRSGNLGARYPRCRPFAAAVARRRRSFATPSRAHACRRKAPPRRNAAGFAARSAGITARRLVISAAARRCLRSPRNTPPSRRCPCL